MYVYGQKNVYKNKQKPSCLIIKKGIRCIVEPMVVLCNATFFFSLSLTITIGVGWSEKSRGWLSSSINILSL
jgi:ABC-type antimicrobial peptide transport system permease subunit